MNDNTSKAEGEAVIPDSERWLHQAPVAADLDALEQALS
jgi:hypothetical protein